ncbi:hypothetical protein D9756_005580 [Leucocoprinus leucothites]|uniref:Uncharacterized protein n=1 Tax=Leucocoprinus leucothites TaxID=201217 RepID=A0A8H5D8X9_9AGAR|nr:hypothetical protein D9756_005580 [Leucoagaricus leucothites]
MCTQISAINNQMKTFQLVSSILVAAIGISALPSPQDVCTAVCRTEKPAANVFSLFQIEMKFLLASIAIAAVAKSQYALKAKLLAGVKAAGDAANPFQGLALPSAISRNQNVPREKRLLGRKAVGAVASLLPPFRGHS